MKPSLMSLIFFTTLFSSLPVSGAFLSWRLIWTDSGLLIYLRAGVAQDNFGGDMAAFIVSPFIISWACPETAVANIRAAHITKVFRNMFSSSLSLSCEESKPFTSFRVNHLRLKVAGDSVCSRGLCRLNGNSHHAGYL